MLGMLIAMLVLLVISVVLHYILIEMQMPPNPTRAVLLVVGLIGLLVIMSRYGLLPGV